MRLESALNRVSWLVRLYGLHTSIGIRQVVPCLFASLLATALVLGLISNVSRLAIDLEGVANEVAQANPYSFANSKVEEPLAEFNIFYDEEKRLLFGEIGRSRETYSYVEMEPLGGGETEDRALPASFPNDRIESSLAYFPSNAQCSENAIGSLGTAEESDIQGALLNLRDNVWPKVDTIDEKSVDYRKHAMLLEGSDAYEDLFVAWKEIRDSDEGSEKEHLEREFAQLFRDAKRDSETIYYLHVAGILSPVRFCLGQLVTRFPLVSLHYKRFVPVQAAVRAYEETIRYSLDESGISCGVSKELDTMARSICAISRSVSGVFESASAKEGFEIRLLNIFNGSFQIATQIAFWWLISFSMLRLIACKYADQEVMRCTAMAGGQRTPWTALSGRPSDWHRSLDDVAELVTKKLGQGQGFFAFVSLAAYQAAYSVLHHTRRLSEVPVALDNLRSSYIGRIEAGSATTDYLQWLIPTLGFLGTIYGISLSLQLVPVMQSPDPVSVTFARVKVGDAVGVAFDTTFFALACAVITVFVDRSVNGLIRSHLDTSLDNVWWVLSSSSNIARIVQYENKRMSSVVAGAARERAGAANNDNSSPRGEHGEFELEGLPTAKRGRGYRLYALLLLLALLLGLALWRYRDWVLKLVSS